MSIVTLRNGKAIDTGLLNDEMYSIVVKEGLEVMSRSLRPVEKEAIEAATVILPKPKRRRRNVRS